MCSSPVRSREKKLCCNKRANYTLHKLILSSKPILLLAATYWTEEHIYLQLPQVQIGGHSKLGKLTF